MKLYIRGGDIACRYGGEEFIVILLVETSMEDTRKRAEELWTGIKYLQVHYYGKPLGKITLSLGVAVFPDHGTSVEDLLRVVDRALYQAKREGRDRVVVVSEQNGIKNSR